MTLQLGIIGFSEGNGHPYSWSAIFNGYSAQHMKSCEFPAIPQYLGQQNWPEDRLSDATVSHIWTQDSSVSKKIARASLISHVVTTPEDMIGEVDGILLARDDAENHLSLARPFLESGLPIYIDKPIAVSLKTLKAIYDLEQYRGQIFTCSALRYAPELCLTPGQREQLGRLRYIFASTPKSWEKYAVHIIEPVLNVIGTRQAKAFERNQITGTKGRQLLIQFSDDITVTLTALGQGISAPIAIRIHGERDWTELSFSDPFTAFRLALQDFIRGVRAMSCQSPYSFNRKVVSIIERGLS